jgi:hypothetical protein
VKTHQCRRCKEKYPQREGKRICLSCESKCSTCNSELTSDTQDKSSLLLRNSYRCKACVATGVRNTVDKDKRRDYDLNRNYGINHDVYLEMLAKQNGCCQICGITEEEHGKRLHVDHNHTTGKVRGLLCNRCNTAIGKFKEDPEVIRKAIQYIERWNNENKLSEK